jgi:hypothetical protein
MFSSPFFWIFFAGILLGFSVAVWIRPSYKRGRARGQDFKVIKSSVYVSLAILLGLAGVFLPGSSKIVDIRLLFMLVGSLFLGGIGYLFPRSVGIPLVCFSALMIALLFYTIGGYSSPAEGAPLFEIRRVTTSLLSVTFNSEVEDDLLIDFEGSSMDIEIDTVIFPVYYFFVPHKVMYRILTPRAMRNQKSGSRGIPLVLFPGVTSITQQKFTIDFAEGTQSAFYIKNNRIVVDKL